MTANRTLAKQRGLSEQAIQYIDQLHDLLEKLIASHTLDVDYHEALELVESVEFDLQRLWKFSEDRRYHTWRNKLAQRWMDLTWAGRGYERKNVPARPQRATDQAVSGPTFPIHLLGQSRPILQG